MANKISQTFSDIKKNTPHHIQWLFLIAAFLVVIILLAMLIGGNKNKAGEAVKNKEVARATADVTLDLNPSQVDWTESDVNEAQTIKINVSASADTKVSLVKFSENIPGMNLRSTCTNIGLISQKVSCIITVDWKPISDVAKTGTEIQITYYAAAASAKLSKLERIPVVVSTKSKVKPEVVAQPITNSEKSDTDKTSVQPSAPMTTEEVNELLADTPSLAPSAKSEKQTPDNHEACYEFAFPGYNLSGSQMGWIKPNGGRYEFHNFSDKNCDSAVGDYNPDTGIITDKKDPSKKIGSDAEHIGFNTINAGASIPMLSNPPTEKTVNRAHQLLSEELSPARGTAKHVFSAPPDMRSLIPNSLADSTVSSVPYDRTFVLRQYKPIPATIVNEIRADPKNMSSLPVLATVDRNVYSDNGRTIIIPAGTTMQGYVTGDLPGPYKSIGRMKINWYRFIRPDGVEFNFNGPEPFSGDSQGRIGVPGYGSTDYMEQFLMPMITAIVPAAVNMIAPISDKFVNQIDLDNNTVTQSGNMRSSELAKNEIITAWNKVAQKLAVDMLDNTVPPFSIAAGTRITVYSPTDLVVTCGDPSSSNMKCAISAPSQAYAKYKENSTTQSGGGTDESWIGQVRSFNMAGICNEKTGEVAVSPEELQKKGITDYRTAVMMCQASLYQSKTGAQQQAYIAAGGGTYKDSKTGAALTQGTKEYNEQVLNLKYDDNGNVKNPFQKEAAPVTTVSTLTCDDGKTPDSNGCCAGETYTDMGDQGFNCCPASGGDCFPPIK